VGIWQLWVRFYATQNLRPSISATINVQVKETAGYAIVVSGKGENDGRVELHNRTCDVVYHKLRSRGFEPEHILYFRFGTPDDTSIEVASPPSVEAIGEAITSWAKGQMIAEPGPLFIVLIGSAQKWQFYVSGPEESIRPWRELDAWLTTLEGSLAGSPAEGQPITLVYGAPYSGSFIPALSREKTPRVIITSSDANELPVTGPEEENLARQGDFFVLELFENLVRGWSFARSFERAAIATCTFTSNRAGNGLAAGLAYPDNGAQHPLLDDNGDKIGSFGFLTGRPGDDGFLSSRILLGYGWPQPEAQITDVPPKQVISRGQPPDLWASVADPDRVQEVWMVIKPPLFSMGTVTGGSWLHRDVEGIRVVLFDADHDGVYSTTDYPSFTETGTYQVLFFVKDRFTGQLGEVWKTKVVILDPDAPAPGEFSILSPEDGATVGSRILLTWGASPKEWPEDEIAYAVQIATDPLFENVVLNRGDVEGTSFLVGEEAGLLDKTTYYWRVWAESFFGKVRLAQNIRMRSTDVGNSLQGDTLYDRSTDSYTIQGNGWGSFGTEDQFRFVHTSARGSFEVSARLENLETATTPAFAGIMIRQTTDPDSPYAMIAIGDDGGVVSASRGVPGSPAWRNEYSNASLPLYMKLVCNRSSPNDAAEITPYYSSDGESWYRGTPINLLLSGDVLVGICVTSGESDLLVKAVVNDFTVSPLADRPGQESGVSTSESPLSNPPPRMETLATGYSTFTTDYGAGLPGYNVLTVLVYNQNDPSQSPPGTTITISPIVGTIHNWMYSGYVPVGDYSIDVTAPNFSPEHRATEVITESPTTEVFTLVPYDGSVSGKVVSANTSADIRGAGVVLEVASGIYLGTTYDAVTDAEGRFSLTGLPAAVEYRITVSKTFYNDYEAFFVLNAGQAKDLGVISLAFTDNDGDGLPDEFELLIVDFDPGDGVDDIADVHGEDDFDGDGQSNGDEYLAGTDPTSAASCLRIISIVSNTADAFTIVWTSASGILYKVHYGESVGGWSLAASDIPGSGTGQNSWTDDSTSGTVPPPGDASKRFYRVEAY
jgi:hypothetical protein